MDLPSNLPDVARAPNEFQRCQLLTIGARKTSAKAPVACALYCKLFRDGLFAQQSKKTRLKWFIFD